MAAVDAATRSGFIIETRESYDNAMRFAMAAHRTPEARLSNYFYAEGIKQASEKVIELFATLPSTADREEYFAPVDVLVETARHILDSNEEVPESLGGREAVRSILYGYNAIRNNYMH